MRVSRVNDRDRDRDRTPSALARDLVLALDHARFIALDRPRARARALDRAHARALDLVGTLDLGRARALARNLAFARARALDRDHAPVLHVRDRGRALDRALDHAHGCAVALVSALDHDRTFGRSRARREAGRVAYSAARLLVGAARLLPAADRARYAEEYRSELWELARAGAGRPGQLGYALRQLHSAPRTGRALRALRRRSAAP